MTTLPIVDTAHLRVLIAEGDAAVRAPLAGLLATSGHEVLQEADPVKVAAFAEAGRPDVALVTAALLNDADGALAADLARRAPETAIVAIGRGGDCDGAPCGGGLAGFLVTPVAPAMLANTLQLAVRTQRALTSARQAAEASRAEIEQDKTLTRALGILMRRTGGTSSDAARLIQRAAEAAGVSPLDIAREVIESEPRRDRAAALPRPPARTPVVPTWPAALASTSGKASTLRA